MKLPMMLLPATSMISDALEESFEHEDGLFLGACYRLNRSSPVGMTPSVWTPVGELTTVGDISALRSK